jgi:hypothetical protein
VVLADDIPPSVSMVVTTNITPKCTSEPFPPTPNKSPVGGRPQCQNIVLHSTLIVASGEWLA